jgi:formiminotetrahydrofolate cyclodeaminase
LSDSAVSSQSRSEQTRSDQRLSDQTLADFVNRLGSTAIAPGSGAAGAVALALAAGCLAKAFVISYRHTNASGLREAADHARSLATIALEGAQRDGDDFRRWLQSHSVPAAEALLQDARKLLCLSSVLQELIATHRPAVIPSLAADLGAALDFIAAFEAIETRNSGELPANSAIAVAVLGNHTR